MQGFGINFQGQLGGALLTLDFSGSEAGAEGGQGGRLKGREKCKGFLRLSPQA